MNVRCPSCRTVFRVDPVKVPEAGVRARCAVCAGTIDVRRDGAVAPRPAPTESRPTPQAVAPPVAPQPAVAAPQPPAPAPEPPAAPPAPPALPPTAPRLSQPFMGPRSVPTTPAERPAAAAPPVARPSAPVFRPTPGQPVTPPPAAPPPAPPPAPAPAAPPSAAPTEQTRARPINPFLQKDPKQKARRLARALVSDMIVYQPAKRQRALAEGTLKAEFDEEIQKSWEEYVEQVGKEMATSTPYWQEALNDILAGGQQIF